MFSSSVRVLVVIGWVALANVSVGPGILLATEVKRTPAATVNTIVIANNAFGLDLYRELVRRSPRENLFFSPYSMSSALAMAFEGAREATAEEMGKTLHFPGAAQKADNHSQGPAWNTDLIHSGMAELNQQSTSQDKTSPEVCEKIARLRKELAETEDQMQATRNTENSRNKSAIEKRGQKLAEELTSLLSQVDHCELRVVNGLWGAKEFPFRKEFLDTLGKYYATDHITSLDFRNDPETARQTINTWCQGQTNGRIADALPATSVSTFTRLVLTNTVYFQGKWADPFDARRTEDADFTVGGQDTIMTPMMSKLVERCDYAAFNADGSYFKTPTMYDSEGEDQSRLYPNERGFLIAELPFMGSELAMTILLPRSPRGLGDLDKLLSQDDLRRWLHYLERRKVQVSLPKFKLQTDHEMTNLLKKLGMVQAFESDRADFSGMSSAKEPIFLSTVIHKACVEVNEEGAEAAAFSGIMLLSAPKPDHLVPFVPEFKTDKPFVFLIRNCKNGTILFLGRIQDPRPGE